MSRGYRDSALVRWCQSRRVGGVRRRDRQLARGRRLPTQPRRNRLARDTVPTCDTITPLDCPTVGWWVTDIRPAAHAAPVVEGKIRGGARLKLALNGGQGVANELTAGHPRCQFRHMQIGVEQEKGIRDSVYDT